MKRLLILGLLFFSSSLYGFELFGLFAHKKDISTFEAVSDAIRAADFNTVFANVNSETPQTDLFFLNELAHSCLGKPIPVSSHRKLISVGKVILALSLFYKLTDYFKSEIKSFKDFQEHYKSVHNIAIDLGSVAGFVSVYDLMNSAANEGFNKQAKYKKQLLIHLYLKTLIKRD